MTGKYFLKLDHFEGPLDLLHHLIKVNEVDIFDIDIFFLANQYLEYLRHVKFENLNDAGDFLSMAAHLIEIKSRSLLPRPEGGHAHDDIEYERLSLQQRLIEYETYRRASEYLSHRPQLGVEVHANFEWMRLEEVFKDVEFPLKDDATALVVLYERMLLELTERRKGVVTARTHMMSVEEVIVALEEFIGTVRFSLFQGLYNKFAARYELVAHLLAMFELVKMHKLKVYQQEFFGPLWMYLADLDESVLPKPNPGLSEGSQEEVALNG